MVKPYRAEWLAHTVWKLTPSHAAVYTKPRERAIRGDRWKRAKVALPGGDAIGSRRLDMHQAGLRQLGARCNIEHGCVVAEAEHLHGAEIQLEFPSVGATENILMAAVLAEGVTMIHNAAR